MKIKLKIVLNPAAFLITALFTVVQCRANTLISSNGEIRFCCPDVDVINVFRLEAMKEP